MIFDSHLLTAENGAVYSYEFNEASLDDVVRQELTKFQLWK